MKLGVTVPIFLLIMLLVVAGCDNGPSQSAPTPTATSAATQPSAENTPATGDNRQSTETVASEATAVVPTEAALVTPRGTIVDAATVTAPATVAADTVPTATPVTATSTGDAITALQALEELRGKALKEMPDARLAMLVNSRPAQEKILLGTSLGDPNVHAPTPGGMGRNWTLIAVSPSQKRAMAFSLDGTTVDLTAENQVPEELLANFELPGAAALDLSKLDPSSVKDSNALAQAAGDRASGASTGIALFAPEALGIGPLPTPEAGGPSPQLAYELFSTDPTTQLFVIFDAKTGAVVLDSGT